jgi:hypothetical protein
MRVGAGAAPEPADEILRAAFEGTFAVVILPTLNEEGGLARTLADLPVDRFDEPGRKIRPIVIDGGSSDGTLAVARKWGVPVLPQTSRGKGGAMLEAMAWAHERAIPFALVLDADATYPTDRILPALDLLAGGTDLVVGVRHRTWGPPTDLTDLVHRVGNIAMSYSASVLARRPILDLCSGFWGVSTERFMELGLDHSSFAIEAELILKSVKRGYSIHQIPVNYYERIGEAKLRAFRDGGRILRTILREGRSPARDGPSPPTPVAWVRDLLSIALSVGTSGALLECSPSDVVQARQMAGSLRRNLPETHLWVGDTRDTPQGGLAVSPSLEPTRGAESQREKPALRVTLPSLDPSTGPSGPAIVSVRSQRRHLTIELPPRSAPTAEPYGLSSPSISGGAMATADPRPVRFPSLLVLTSRLDFRPEHQHRTLLSANGFNLLWDDSEPVLVPPAPPLSGFSGTA